jgi:hypothetical protein
LGGLGRPVDLGLDATLGALLAGALDEGAAGAVRVCLAWVLTLFWGRVLGFALALGFFLGFRFGFFLTLILGVGFVFGKTWGLV